MPRTDHRGPKISPSSKNGFLRWVLLNVRRSKPLHAMASSKGMKYLSEYGTRELHVHLAENTVNAKVIRGAVNDTDEEFGGTRRTLSRILAKQVM